MTITGAFVLWAVIWFMTLLMILPLRLTTQAEAGEVTDGTPPSAPVNPAIRRKMIWTTAITLVLWLPLCLVIASGWITIADIDVFGTGSTAR
jgi:predicted secreted protein